MACCSSGGVQVQVGRACKRLIDYGRLLYLRDLSYHAELVTYCDTDVTPENSSILAWPSHKEEEPSTTTDA